MTMGNFSMSSFYWRYFMSPRKVSLVGLNIGKKDSLPGVGEHVEYNTNRQLINCSVVAA